jgi:hypothetical protein
MEAHYTHTTWHVDVGNQEEFVRRWVRDLLSGV